MIYILSIIYIFLSTREYESIFIYVSFIFNILNSYIILNNGREGCIKEKLFYS